MLKLKDTTYSISKTFQVGPLDLLIKPGKHTAIIGESGCGKTTLLKIIYGLYNLDHGNIYWNDIKITGPKENLIPGMPFIKYLSQDFDLMPYITVEENINKFLSRLESKISKDRTDELMEVVEMTAYATTKVKYLSGGQKQRVALAQALANEPELLLLDEPFAHIDNFRKNKLRRHLFAYLKKQNITCIIATHDSTDVLSYMDETVIMRNGKILAHDNTDKLYQNPPSYYAGSLFNDINELPQSWFYDDKYDPETILLYPHQIKVIETGITVTVINCYFMGSHYLIKAKSGTYDVLLDSPIHYPIQTELNIGLNK